MMLADWIVAGTCALSAMLLTCMLQVEFRRSSRAFRWSVKALVVGLLVSSISPWLPPDGAEAASIVRHLALLAVLGLVRWRQLRTGRCAARS